MNHLMIPMNNIQTFLVIVITVVLLISFIILWADEYLERGFVLSVGVFVIYLLLWCLIL